MILRRLAVKCFGPLNPGAVAAEFSPTFNVVHGPNESGKSTLFRALEYALYQRHGVGGDQVHQEIRPAGAAVAPEVELEFDAGGARYRIFKRFTARKAAELSRRDGAAWRLIAEGAAADDAVLELIGARARASGKAGPDLRGLGEILLVDQGRLRIAEEGFGAAARDRLQAVVHQVGVTQEAHDLLRRMARERDRWFTPGGDVRKGSDLQRLRDDVAALAKRRDELLARVREAEEREAEIARLIRDAARDDFARSEAALAAELKAAREDRIRATTLAAARDAATARAAARADVAAKIRDAAREAVAEAARRQAAATRALAAAESADAAEAEVRRAATVLRDAEEALAAEDAKRADVEAAAALADDAAAWAEARSVAEAARTKLDAFAAHEAQREAAERELAARPRPIAEEVAAFRRARRDADDAADALRTLALRATLTAARPLTVRGPTGEVAVGAGATVELSGDDPLALEVEGVLRLTVAGPSVADRPKHAAALEAARTRLREFADRFGVDDAATAERLAAERAELTRAAESARRARDSVLGGDALADVKRRRGEAEQRAAAVLRRRPEWTDAPPTDADRERWTRDRRDVAERFAARLALRKAGRDAAAAALGDARRRH
ncbi:MAG TPA: AAA family ATPase, partial [Planctomycetota bacterium]|nr:AAA family ATPase [Planctomycetota bacterium]